VHKYVSPENVAQQKRHHILKEKIVMWKIAQREYICKHMRSRFKDYPVLVERIAEVLNEYDPIGIIYHDCKNYDEYISEAEMIASKIEEKKGKDVLDIVFDVFQITFEGMITEKRHFREMAKKISKILKRKRM